jgi:hypothetical protein
VSPRPFRLALLCAAALVPWRGVVAQAYPPLPAADRIRLAEALRLGEMVRDRVWPGWSTAALPILIVADSVEYLVDHPRPSADFQSLGRDRVTGREVLARARVFAPTLLATFPAVGGVPTAVVGTAERTGRRSGAWVLAVLHEQFHQWQYSRPGYYAGVAGLDLAGGDSTGRWMLEYPFPYDAAPVRAALHRLAAELAAPASAATAGRVLAARRDLGRVLTPPQARYLEFQLWQEGVARYVELAAARAAAGLPGPPAGFRALPDYEPYDLAARRLERELRHELEVPGTPGRVAFYPIGAATAGLIAGRVPDWRRRYAATPFRLDHLLEAAAAR